MKRMKGNHLKVIEKIQDQYQAIEEHTQVKIKCFFSIVLQIICTVSYAGNGAKW